MLKTIYKRVTSERIKKYLNKLSENNLTIKEIINKQTESKNQEIKQKIKNQTDQKKYSWETKRCLYFKKNNL